MDPIVATVLRWEKALELPARPHPQHDGEISPEHVERPHDRGRTVPSERIGLSCAACAPAEA